MQNTELRAPLERSQLALLPVTFRGLCAEGPRGSSLAPTEIAPGPGRATGPEQLSACPTQHKQRLLSERRSRDISPAHSPA